MIFDSSSMTNNHHLFRYKALERISQFALPYEDFTMALFKLEFDANLVYEFLMKEENEILKLESHNDTTGLDVNAISTRWDKYNLFTRYADEPLIGNIRDQVLTNYYNFCRLTGSHAEKVFVHAWYNVIRKGQCISEHTHDYGTYAYLSGNVYVKGYDKNSSTKYLICNRDENLEVKNNNGDFTLFPMWLPHQTNIYRGEQPRITIGINMYPMRFYNDFMSNETHNWMKHVYTP